MSGANSFKFVLLPPQSDTTRGWAKRLAEIVPEAELHELPDRRGQRLARQTHDIVQGSRHSPHGRTGGLPLQRRLVVMVTCARRARRATAALQDCDQADTGYGRRRVIRAVHRYAGEVRREVHRDLRQAPRHLPLRSITRRRAPLRSITRCGRRLGLRLAGRRGKSAASCHGTSRYPVWHQTASVEGIQR